MPVNLTLLDADGITPFSTHSFGAVLAGTGSTPKMFFVESNGDQIALSVELMLEAIPANDGVNYAQMCQMQAVNGSTISPSHVVDTLNGSIAVPDIYYKVAPKDRWGHEGEASAAYHVALTGSTNKVTLSWGALGDVSTYVVYSSTDGTNFYKAGEVGSPSFADTTGTNDGTSTPAAAGSVAYVVGTWTNVTVALGDMAPGTRVPVGSRANVPANASAVGNTRQYKFKAIYYGT